jgi:cell division protein FtsB
MDLSEFGITDDAQFDNEPLPEDDKPSKLRLSRWSVFGLIFFSALATVFYVWNVIRTDSLLSENQDLRIKLRQIRNENMILTSKLNRLQSPERIIQIAKDKLGLVKSNVPPESLK